MTQTLMLAYNEGERAKMRMHFPDATIVVPGNAFSNAGQVYDQILYSERVRNLEEDFYLNMVTMAAPTAIVRMVTL